VTPDRRRELWGYAFWGAIALLVAVPELMAAFGENATPWATISATVAHLEGRYDWVAVVVLGGLVVLTVHLAFFPWPDRSGDER
jgi:hypothetical protein